MSTRVAYILAAVCGIVGAVIVVLAVYIIPVAPTSVSIEQLREFATLNHDSLAIGGWLQAVGAILTVLFAIALVHLAGAMNRYAGWATLLSGAAILAITLVQITFYLASAQAAESADTLTGAVSNALVQTVQHALLIAPVLLLPLGFVLLGSRVLPQAFAYLALVMGAVLQVVGVMSLIDPLQSVIDILMVAQAVWFAAAGLMLFVRAAQLQPAGAGNIRNQARGDLKD